MSSWWWRTKPRSIIKTVQWFKEFGKFDGKNWDEYIDVPIGKVSKKIHPIRREYIYNAHRDEDPFLGGLTLSQYISGEFDGKKDKESNGRNDKTTYEFFGFAYVDENGIIHVSDVGKLIINGTFDDEDFLKQLLKLYFPNQISSKSGMGCFNGIFPMELLLKAIERYKYLNRSEVALLFGCSDSSKMDDMLKAIGKFRNGYERLKNKNNEKAVKDLCAKVFVEAYGNTSVKIGSYYDYAEAFCRSLSYTGLFKLSGRSIATKVICASYSIAKIEMLLQKYNFYTPSFKNVDDYMSWYGNPNATILPWDDAKSRRELLEGKLKYLRNIDFVSNAEDTYGVSIRKSIGEKITEFEKRLANPNNNGLRAIEKDVVNYITEVNERKYIEIIVVTKRSRKEILAKYGDILNNDDMSALWLEVNTWKSLLAINGNKEVKRNFNIEEDLTPKSFAPGVGNTPDMELYIDDYIVLPEVSLMSGVRQWEHEASSVIDHVLSFIDTYKNKKVIGLFISTAINIRTNWQFFILNRESWVGNPVPVVPLTIKQYYYLIENIYDKNIDIDKFVKLLFEIHDIALGSENYRVWNEKTIEKIDQWISNF
ncbi:AlwI family type II restriction endonuclease [Candidatus Saccharibacteria bacterium]|nr:AlwI family type II restriction endonuclease [Candidatus Saccharibacteria bacterium]